MIFYDLDRLVRQPRDLEDLIDIVEYVKRPVTGATGGRMNLINDSDRHMARMMCVMALKSTMADDQQLWGYPEVGAHLGISVSAARNRKSRGSLPAPDDTTVPDRPRWRPATFEGWKPHPRRLSATSPTNLGFALPQSASASTA
ncbi:hypothetical protein ACWQ06_21950 [Streptomyces angustmyceticus]